MDLSPEQFAAAKAIGCAFFPATELQVQRLTMQQRVFRVDGKPYLVSRNGSYFETAGTLRALLAAAAPLAPPVAAAPEPASPEAAREALPAAAPQPAATPEPAAITPAATEPVAEPAIVTPAAAAPTPEPAAVAPMAAAPAEAVAPAPARPKRSRKPAAPPPAPEPAAPPATTEVEPAATTPFTATDTSRSERMARLARRRAGGTPLLHWQIAGPARRGRLKKRF